MEKEKEVVISESSAQSSSSFSDLRIICRVCQKQFSQYTCPRCNTRYCSLNCYKNHSVRCTESFMRENVLDEMKQIQPEDETKKKMMDILKRFHSEDQEEEINSDDEDDDDNTFSEELIQKVLSGEEIKLEDLNPDEIKKFKKSLISGELSKLIQPWTPWWAQPSAKSLSLSQSGCQLITPINTNNSESEPVSEIPPGPDSPLPAVSQLIKSEPSPFLAVHLIDVLYSYCFTVRLYNGDWKSDPFGSVSVFLNISRVLGEDFRPESAKEALNACLERACSPVYKQMGGLGFAIGVIDDVIALLELGRDALICALCDLRRMVEEGERVGKREKVGRRERGKVRGGERKVYFLMCWVNEQPNEAWVSLAGLVRVEREALNEVLERNGKMVKDEKKMKNSSKMLIEEV
ncbi:hypothetical protein LUZ60_014703 [Juncus effusus]|nr:hypothetical protein LUZ60_014703 [Juncus effusus]